LVTKFKCLNCGIDFIHPAIKTIGIGDSKTAIIGSMAIQGDTLTTHVCPNCQDWKLEEYVEVPEELSDVISVPYEGVAVKLAEGYKVVEIYAKTITMKLPKPKPQQSEDKFTIDAKMYYSMLHPEVKTE
jgi:predicted RNA-binding Zn-ribbon protein involved in translation (DUF1610 family)